MRKSKRPPAGTQRPSGMATVKPDQGASMPKSKTPPEDRQRPRGMATVKTEGKPERSRTHEGNRDKAGVVDERLQLVNGGERGLSETVSLPLEAITSLLGIMLDVDPDRLHPDLAAPAVLADPKKMWKKLVGIWLSRHPIFAKAQVVSSGRGLHVILRFSKPVQFETPNERAKWAAAVKLVQRLLPTDLDCPGITALTRPIGSINGKCGELVLLLHRSVVKKWRIEASTVSAASSSCSSAKAIPSILWKCSHSAKRRAPSHSKPWSNCCSARPGSVLARSAGAGEPASTPSTASADVTAVAATSSSLESSITF